MNARSPRLLLLVGCLLLLAHAPAVGAQSESRPPTQPPAPRTDWAQEDSADYRQQAPEESSPPSPWQRELWRPRHAIELAFSEESLWAAYRGHLPDSAGFLTGGFLTNEDDDWAGVLRLMRFGEPAPDVPVGLGVGIGLVAVGLEEEDATIGGLTLTGQADWLLETHYPMRLLAEASYAPGVSTFGDGEALFDLALRWEIEISPWAAGYLGYRRFEVELDDGSVSELDSRVHVGVRMGF